MGDRAVWLPTLFWVLELALWLAGWSGLESRPDVLVWPAGREPGDSSSSSRRRTESEAARGGEAPPAGVRHGSIGDES